MVKLIWTDQAVNDLGSIGEYIAENSEKYAKLTVKKLFERPDILKNFPQAGRIVPEKNDPNVRELIEGNYRIIYEIISTDQINILTVYHSARDLRI
ncbi:MAG TPA: type II toxin-antitoxin system RelE/ParE family toxin [Cytophagales bacterium]|jgi:toxin ParE1/3/4|nr:type II toxin-antitoxin system RelE/ParE family toxin [Cytophagales bacterium]